LRSGALQSRGPGYLRLEETGVPVLRSIASQELRAASRPGHGTYSITAACSGPCACLRKLALVEPIMIASGMAHKVTIITNW
jgi:hypothetical protein